MRPTRLHALATVLLLPFAVACAPAALEGEGPSTPDAGGVGEDTGGQADSGGVGGDAAPADDVGGVVNPFDGDAAEATAGKAVYDSNGCGNCHGADGKTATFKDLSVSATDTADQVLFDAIQLGVPSSAMVSYSSAIDADDTWRIVTWIRAIE
jgi:mono/diheme cytochrome c family protein